MIPFPLFSIFSRSLIRNSAQGAIKPCQPEPPQSTCCIGTWFLGCLHVVSKVESLRGQILAPLQRFLHQLAQRDVPATAVTHHHHPVYGTRYQYPVPISSPIKYGTKQTATLDKITDFENLKVSNGKLQVLYRRVPVGIKLNIGKNSFPPFDLKCHAMQYSQHY